MNMQIPVPPPSILARQTTPKTAVRMEVMEVLAAPCRAGNKSNFTWKQTPCGKGSGPTVLVLWESFPATEVEAALEGSSEGCGLNTDLKTCQQGICSSTKTRNSSISSCPLVAVLRRTLEISNNSELIALYEGHLSHATMEELLHAVVPAALVLRLLRLFCNSS